MLPSFGLTVISESDFQSGFLEGSIAVPIGQNFGLQVDGLYARKSSNLFDTDVYGVGGHFFTRDPKKGLLGLYGQYLEIDDFTESYRIGVEAEIYHENYSLEFFAGSDNLETESGFISLISVDEDFFVGQAIAAYYPDENFRISAGISNSFEETSFLAGLEWQVSTNKVVSNLFMDTELGEESVAVRGGIRFYFGEDNKSLIRRHREDNVQARLLDNTSALANCADDIFFGTLVNDVLSFVSPSGLASVPIQDGCDFN